MRAANAGQALALCMVDELVRCGMTDACLAPGSRSTPIALALAGNPAIRLHVSIDERSAGFMALGIAKESRRAVAMVTTSGTATANLLPAVVEASQAAVPLVVLTADRPPELRDTGAGQTIDQIKLYGSFVRWFAEVGVAEARAGSVGYWRSLACRAWINSLEPTAGPVHLNLPFRDPLVPASDEAGFPFELEGRPQGRPWLESGASVLAPSGEAIAGLAGEMRQAQRGLIVVGFAEWGPGGRGDPAAAAALASAAGWPLVAEATSGARIKPAVSAYDAILRHRPFAEDHVPDLVIRIGSVALSSALQDLLDHSVRQVAVQTGPFAPDPRRAASVILRADPALLCEQLVPLLEPGRPGPWLRDWNRAEAAARKAIDGLLDAGCEISEPAVARNLAAWMPEGSTLVVASSMPVRDLDWFMRPRKGVRYLANRGVNGIDGFVATALGVALSSGRFTAALCGDLSLIHDQNALLYAANNPVDAVFVVVNNNGGGIFSFLPQAGDEAHFERLFGTPHNIELGSLASTYRLGYRLLGEPGELSPAMEAAREKGGVHILEIQTDRAANVQVHRQIWRSVAEALEREFS